MTGKEALDIVMALPTVKAMPGVDTVATAELARLRDNDSLYLGLRSALKSAGCNLRPVRGSTGTSHEALFNDRAAALEKKLARVAEMVRVLSVELETL